MPAVREQFWQSPDGLALFYRDYAPEAAGADPLLCLPGLTRNSDDFVPLARQLAGRRRVITPDLRGRGRSAADPAIEHYHPAQYADDMYGLLDALDLPRVAIVGTSLGGWMAMLMARQRPGALSAVVMNDIGPEIEEAGAARVRAYAGCLPPARDWSEAVGHLRRQYDVVYPDWSKEQWLRYARASYRELDDGSLEPRLDGNVGVAMRQGLSGLRDDPWQLFEALRDIPLLVLRGALSDILSASTVERMRALKPDMHYALVPGRGHPPYLDEPVAARAIGDFFDVH